MSIGSAGYIRQSHAWALKQAPAGYGADVSDCLASVPISVPISAPIIAGVNTATHTTVQRLQRLAVKEAVSLGGLAADDRALALAVCWAALPAGAVCTEPEINRHLKTALGSPCAWLGTDHVELRRWLVDMGWLTRDGFGREYQRTQLEALRAEQRPLAESLAGIEVGSWVAACRAQHHAARDARRRTWQAGAGPAA